MLFVALVAIVIKDIITATYIKELETLFNPSSLLYEI
jgi:hypothetical protein